MVVFRQRSRPRLSLLSIHHMYLGYRLCQPLLVLLRWDESEHLFRLVRYEQSKACVRHDAGTYHQTCSRAQGTVTLPERHAALQPVRMCIESLRVPELERSACWQLGL
jgi:hypothetical protein